MPKRTDIQKILVLGAGPITIGQACEFDYSGTQACKALKDEGYEVILVNSNPATIMTDPEVADRTYIEPVTAQVVREVIAIERPQALLPTMGGQTSLNVAVELAESGVLAEFDVELIGAKLEAIKLAEDRELFKDKMLEIGLYVPNSGIARNSSEAREIGQRIGFPIIIRPAFTLGGAGGGIAYNQEELDDIANSGLAASPVSEILLEESVLGWKELELEVMRDKLDNALIICSIENFDPMGVHTGDSITVAPLQTVTDRDYQKLRDAALLVIRAIGVETGGSNIQFGINPTDGRIVVIEMNPRVSRSSALASKATGYPIAKIAAKLAIGLTLDEISNDITRETKASFEPTLDYVVTKIPRFNFEKFKGADTTLTTQMKSVGEVMAIGRTFQESVQKALRGMEVGLTGFAEVKPRDKADFWEWRRRLSVPSHHRITDIYGALSAGISAQEIIELSSIDPWFIDNLAELHQISEEIKEGHFKVSDLNEGFLRALKRKGFGDMQLARLLGVSEEDVYQHRKALGVTPSYKMIDTCSAEFKAYTPYMYSTYESESEMYPATKPRVIILGGGPNRIGQGIEFDYCCVHASLALRDLGYEAVMINSNPETVSTDYDVSDRLYFEPLTLEDVTNIAELEKPDGIIVQLGGQTPLKLAKGLEARGFKILGTSPESIDIAEDRERFGELINRLGLKQPQGAVARSPQEAIDQASGLGYPVMVRPSYVLGGRSMSIVYSQDDLERWIKDSFASSDMAVLIDQFLENAIEIDVDAISDGRATVIAGIMEHIEQAGIHSGDSTCVLPSQTIPFKIVEEIRTAVTKLATELKVIGLMNIQFALKGEELYILEVNPRASRTVPFVSKATGVPWARIAASVMVGKTLSELGITPRLLPPHVSVKSVVIPFKRFAGSQISLGPEMRSTGEVMGIASQFGLAFAKAQIAAGHSLPTKGRVFVSVSDSHKQEIIGIAQSLYQMGFELIATRGTATAIKNAGIPTQITNKVSEGRPNLVDRIKNGEIQLVINIPSGRTARDDDQLIRRAAINYNAPVVTTVSGAKAVVQGISALQAGTLGVKSLQDYHQNIAHWESTSTSRGVRF
ncbi:MAG: carbamoyl-phosphate synthase large subunit [Candidatus Obscuribacter sp.]|jgi:carbamoyl-phosphate synthase large subunit|nr:carbamoyl-phosphate synthase large subunit [Candidatus Obscuribacter sp.]MDQ5967099.1 carbamoyl-phosphate synthase large subunit [Cyanobacteriota bacterium erpe_2018_sw_39hr_WHONDRS-SW48-000098_B_bin.30]MBK7836433.1 carbamoyl-phosphate synthase large subunit [Candidatus Obscuribacter sp.]MBK9617729.1 carbamoyl-phosphate synthase large subunit [Candidatus Obscuribacter sp.]MBL0187373.1 carbamoyl-phosphate synthase large subunit [Candidatus Obscuribacter sp.]